ncbi:hypothetical protein PTTG_27716 [Puccinia triticina 1-1 BBBD Race 1]|uniref:Helicase ATP-binding domain-containing protein n=1 Tax=Puccinia triticina (isolate 1-1 / race 1 (BBBD)) TaxID=630390 RepID=A0A180GI01_PUCT1|nr:hypothetical protein PTTG_27716 [Puccinia triticina 1-1 BBBD Race 1]
MSSTYCLGKFSAPISSALHSARRGAPQMGFLQRGRFQLHVYCAPRERVGDLSPIASEHLKPLLGPISTCSTPPTSRKISPPDHNLIKLRLFVVTHQGTPPELWGCVFCHSHHVNLIHTAFAAAGIELTQIWNYHPSVFFNIPHLVIDRPEPGVTPHEALLISALSQCHTNLKPHQLSALEFLRRNESGSSEALLLWNHPTNAWIHQFMEQAGINTTEIPAAATSRGSILADNMGLGKTLTALTYVLATRDLAVEFQWANWNTRSSATLVICLLATLSNWENEIKLHFTDQAINYHVFHGPARKKLRKQDLQSALLVLTTYEMIGEGGNRSVRYQPTVESLDLCWFRIILDEAHLMRNPSAHRTQNIQQLQSQFLLCLTGTPVQNCLSDLQSLITTLNIAPWDNKLIWQRFLIPKVNCGAAEAIRSITQLMNSVCLRRTKEVFFEPTQEG